MEGYLVGDKVAVMAEMSLGEVTLWMTDMTNKNTELMGI